MNNTASKKDFFYIIVLILTFITVIVGATFALYSWIFDQEEGTSAVYTGTFSISYLFGDKINFHLLYPTEKPTIDTEENVYRNKLTITNIGNLDGRIERLVIEINKNEFEEKRIEIEQQTLKPEPIILRYSLYNKDEEEIIEGCIEGSDEAIIAENLELKSNETEEYTLLIWLAENGEEQNDYMKLSFIGTIRADLFQEEYFKK